MSDDFAETYYSILEVPETATARELKAARNSLLLEYHPDKIPSDLGRLRQDAEERTMLINEAYSVLANPATRRHYDDQLRDLRTAAYPAPPPPPPPGPAPPQRSRSRDAGAWIFYLTTSALDLAKALPRRVLVGLSAVVATSALIAVGAALLRSGESTLATASEPGPSVQTPVKQASVAPDQPASSTASPQLHVDIPTSSDSRLDPVEMLNRQFRLNQLDVIAEERSGTIITTGLVSPKDKYKVSLIVRSVAPDRMHHDLTTMEH